MSEQYVQIVHDLSFVTNRSELLSAVVRSLSPSLTVFSGASWMSYKSAFREFSLFLSSGSIVIMNTGGVCVTVFVWAITRLITQKTLVHLFAWKSLNVTCMEVSDFPGFYAELHDYLFPMV